MRIEKKVWPGYIKLIKNGKKKFDVRIADFRCKPGDVLVLREWDPRIKKYTGREVEKRVTYVLRTRDCAFWKKGDISRYGFQVIGIE